jgi:site-specific recombinase XerD
MKEQIQPSTGTPLFNPSSPEFIANPYPSYHLLRETGPMHPCRSAGEKAEIGFKVHPHMLRHACGYALANKGLDTRTLQAYLGHRSINSTTRYAALAPGRFKNIWGRA